VAFNDSGLFRSFANLFEVSNEDNETTLQFELFDLHCNDECWSKFKEGYMKCLPKDKYLNL